MDLIRRWDSETKPARDDGQIPIQPTINRKQAMFKDGAPREEAATMTARKMGRQKTPEPRKENTPERDAPPWRLGATVGGMTPGP